MSTLIRQLVALLTSDQAKFGEIGAGIGIGKP